MPREKKRVQGIVKMADFKAWYVVTQGLPGVVRVKVPHARIAIGNTSPSRRFLALFSDGEDNVVVAFYRGVAYYAVVDTTVAGDVWRSLPEATELEVYF